MATNLRKMGFHVKSQIPWGTHFCLFYETKEDLLDTLVPYFKAVLEGNEFCVWVVADPLTEEDASLALNQAVPPFELVRVTSAWNRNLTQARQNQQAEFAR